MKLRRAGLVQPPPRARPSGGDLYNRRILQRAAADGFPLRAVGGDDPELAAGDWDLLVWDSLLLERVTRLPARRTIVLLHYLPSLDPALDPPARAVARAIERRAIGEADRTIAAGEPVAIAARALAPDATIVVCEPGVAPEFLQRRPSLDAASRRWGNAPGLLTVAHLLPAKGHGHLLDILAGLRGLPWHWHVVGDVAADARWACELRMRADRAGIASRITWHGALEQSEVASLMDDCELFVFPSLFEAYGTAVAEAAAAGMPVLTTRVGAAGCLVRHGVSGYVVDAGDWDGFAGHLRRLLLEPARRAAFRESACAAPVRNWDVAFREFRAICEAAAPG